MALWRCGLGFARSKAFAKRMPIGSSQRAATATAIPEAVWLRAGVAPSVLERLAEADGFSDMGHTRRDALWLVKAIRGQQPLPLFNDPIDGESISRT